jgi:hypothetical protein
MKSTSRKTRKRKGCTAIRNDPELWERVKRSIRKGGWSARKSQLAVALYKKKGGTYKGPKKSCNSLSKWTREDWGYISDNKNKSNRRNKSTKRKGRYLPKKVREMLTPYEKRKENRLKGNKVGQKIPYSKSLLKKIRKVLYKIKYK